MSIARDIANDIIAQLAEAPFAAAVPYTAAYRRMYIDALENMPPAGTADSKLKITLAPAAFDADREAWARTHRPQPGHHLRNHGRRSDRRRRG